MIDRKWVLVIGIGLFLTVLFSLSISAQSTCWAKTTRSTCAADDNCNWYSEGSRSHCEEKSCWDSYTENGCNSFNVTGKSCLWENSTEWGECNRAQCWNLHSTNESSCVNNSQGLGCSWSGECHPALGKTGSRSDCYDIDGETTCLVTTGCEWGFCNEQTCSGFSTEAACTPAIDRYGNNCTWGGSSCSEQYCGSYKTVATCDAATGINCEWRNNYCQEEQCWFWSQTNESNCIDNTGNLSCQWTNETGTCRVHDCWSEPDLDSCGSKSECAWTIRQNPGSCEQIECWWFSSLSYKNVTAGHQSCTNTSYLDYGMNCTWQGVNEDNLTDGYCYEDYSDATLGCNSLYTSYECWETDYCVWQPTNVDGSTAGGTCTDPGTAGIGAGDSGASGQFNPGCYIFDFNQTYCNATHVPADLGVQACGYNGTACLDTSGTVADGLTCENLNDSLLCSGIPVLSSCCQWNGTYCHESRFTNTCYENVEAKNEDRCEDASSETRCQALAGTPWYMPCKWDSTKAACKFNADKIFEGESAKNLMTISNKNNCQYAGGKWITESFCSGAVAVSDGRCENKFDDETDCDRACFACETRTSAGEVVVAGNAQDSCESSGLGYCEYTASTSAPNGIGYCGAKEQYKKGIANDCDSSCGDCTYGGNPSATDEKKQPQYLCVNSKANKDGGGCQWVEDSSLPTKGLCLGADEKTCLDACDRCGTQSDCTNIGRTNLVLAGSCSWSGTTNDGSCTSSTGSGEVCWDGEDNDNNGLVDCEDTGCYADSYCGLVEGDCWGWGDQTGCEDNSCEWVTDKWGSWCDYKGARCWEYDEDQLTCQGVPNITEALNISSARLDGNLLNESVNFSLSKLGYGWVNGSVVITNETGHIITGNFTVNYTTREIFFVNDTFMITLGGSSNITNVSYQYNITSSQNCDWNEDPFGSGWCEDDYRIGEDCWGNNQTNCDLLNSTNGGECVWQADPYCDENPTDSWCLGYAGQCEHSSFLPSNCWENDASSTDCNAADGCTWQNDTYSQFHCEVNWSNSCYSYQTSGACATGGCLWRSENGGNWCDNAMNGCWSKTTQTTCEAFTDATCSWDTWSNSCKAGCYADSRYNVQSTCEALSGCMWKEPGYCNDAGGSSCWSQSTEGGCSAVENCRWKDPGWCDPLGGGFQTGGFTGGGHGGSDCFKYDGDQDSCKDKAITGSSCSFYPLEESFCEMNHSTGCWNYGSEDGGCNATNGCWWAGSYCSELVQQCWENNTLTSNGTLCDQNQYCNYTSFGEEAGGFCEGRCFSAVTESECGGIGSEDNFEACKWVSGWCNPAGEVAMFDSMESGAPVPLAVETCPENIQSSADICGIGMKDMGDAYGFGAQVFDVSNSSFCNKEKIQSHALEFSGGASAVDKVGSGNDTVQFAVYLDTDGIATGACSLDSDSTAEGYEFRLLYSATWDATNVKVAETNSMKKCENNNWVATDIKVSSWKKLMCSEIGGPMVGVRKDDLAKLPSLYDSSADIRVYAATIGNGASISSPTDTAGPGYVTPGAIDFDVASAFDYDANSAQYEGILQKGYVSGEDCFNSVDDDNDGTTDCADWECQFYPVCSGLGVNAAGYSDTSMPSVTGVKVEEYIDSALIMYDTNKPANGTVQFYSNDSTCRTQNASIFDVGVTSSNVREYKLWHHAKIYNDGGVESLSFDLDNGTKYYYKLKLCDDVGKCALSKCSSFKTPNKRTKCAFCDFTVKMIAPTGWNVYYDIDQDGTYEHQQGKVCGADAGIRVNYSTGRFATILLNNSDDSARFEFRNVTLTKSGLNDKVRTISGSGDLISSGDIIGLNSDTRDKIINNLHPEQCYVKVPFTGTCNNLLHCDDSGANCVDRTSEGTLIDASQCIWSVPFCEFSTYRETAAVAASSSSTSSGGGGGGGGGGAGISVTPVENAVARNVKSWGFLTPGQTESMVVSSSKIAVGSVTFTVANEVKGAQMGVTSVSSLPEAVTKFSGSVYQYLDISLANVEEADLSEAFIDFTVDTEWLTSMGISADEIFLYRFKDTWNALSTTHTGNGGGLAAFRAYTPGFSSFVIGVQTDSPAPAAVTGGAVVDTVTSEAETVPPTQDFVPTEQSSRVGLWVFLATIVIVIIGWWVLHRRETPVQPKTNRKRRKK